MAEQVAFNLLREEWLPVRRHSGAIALIRPAQLTDAYGTDPVVALDWPRADFRIAGLEFLIGLLATAAAPRGHRAWYHWWSDPPDPATLDAAFAPFAHAFDLDGSGPRFLQDLEELPPDPKPISELLIEVAGNADMFVRSGQVVSLARSTAAIALFTLQNWAPEGGRGHLTGLRGGGPLVTLAMPRSRPTMWELIWANVPLRPEGLAEPDQLPSIFPWLGPGSGARPYVVNPENSHPLQAFWGMPRRIRLDFADGDPRPCGLTGLIDCITVSTWRQRPQGIKYQSWGRIHPLTPYRAEKKTSEYIPLHGQPGGIGYREWVGLVVADQAEAQVPSDAVVAWRDGRAAAVGAGEARLLAAGYDMKSMKARAFVESEMPLPAAPDEATRRRRDALATRLVLSADLVAGLLRSAIRFALFSPGATVKLDAALLSAARERFWEQTEGGFFDLLTREPEDATRLWLDRLRDVALWLFDEVAPLTPENGNAAPRISRARRQLLFAMAGFGKDGQALYAHLELVSRKPRAGKRKLHDP